MSNSAGRGTAPEFVTDNNAAFREQLEALTGEGIAALEAVGETMAMALEAGKVADRGAEAVRDPGVGRETVKERNATAAPSKDREARGIEMGL